MGDTAHVSEPIADLTGLVRGLFAVVNSRIYDLDELLAVVLDEIHDLGNGVAFTVNHQAGRPVGSTGSVARRDAYVFLSEHGVLTRWTVHPDVEEGRAVAERLARERAVGEQRPVE